MRGFCIFRILLLFYVSEPIRTWIIFIIVQQNTMIIISMYQETGGIHNGIQYPLPNSIDKSIPSWSGGLGPGNPVVCNLIHCNKIYSVNLQFSQPTCLWLVCLPCKWQQNFLVDQDVLLNRVKKGRASWLTLKICCHTDWLHTSPTFSRPHWYQIIV